jgi:hypothetical protein
MADGPITSRDGRRVAIGDAALALGELVGPDLRPDLVHWVAQVAVDAATPALERDWRARDAELVAHTTAALERAIEALGGVRDDMAAVAAV